MQLAEFSASAVLLLQPYNQILATGMECKSMQCTAAATNTGANKLSVRSQRRKQKNSRQFYLKNYARIKNPINPIANGAICDNNYNSIKIKIKIKWRERERDVCVSAWERERREKERARKSHFEVDLKSVGAIRIFIPVWSPLKQYQSRSTTWQKAHLRKSLSSSGTQDVLNSFCKWVVSCWE